MAAARRENARRKVAHRIEYHIVRYFVRCARQAPAKARSASSASRPRSLDRATSRHSNRPSACSSLPSGRRRASAGSSCASAARSRRAALCAFDCISLALRRAGSAAGTASSGPRAGFFLCGPLLGLDLLPAADRAVRYFRFHHRRRRVDGGGPAFRRSDAPRRPSESGPLRRRSARSWRQCRARRPTPRRYGGHRRRRAPPGPRPPRRADRRAWWRASAPGPRGSRRARAGAP